MMMLMTTFDGKPALGGQFNPTTGTYYKVCRSPNGGRHPHHFDLGGIDDPIIRQLQGLGCQKIVLSLAGKAFEITFREFLAHAYEQRWNDPRFPYPRWYCPAVFWHTETELPREEEQPVTKHEQAALFGPADLQDPAHDRRWSR